MLSRSCLTQKDQVNMDNEITSWANKILIKASRRRIIIQSIAVKIKIAYKRCDSKFNSSDQETSPTRQLLKPRFKMTSLDHSSAEYRSVPVGKNHLKDWDHTVVSVTNLIIVTLRDLWPEKVIALAPGCLQRFRNCDGWKRKLVLVVWSSATRQLTYWGMLIFF